MICTQSVKYGKCVNLNQYIDENNTNFFDESSNFLNSFVGHLIVPLLFG